MINSIQNLDEYVEVMNKIEYFIQKAGQSGGVDALAQEDAEELQMLSIMASVYEKAVRTSFLDAPKSISDMIKIKMMHLRLKQKGMAELLHISESRLSEVLSGKRKVNIELAKKLHQILKIEAEFILQTA